MWKTWANLLTLIRLMAAAPCALAAFRGQWVGAALLLTAAILTDLLDGPVARRFNHQTALGGLFDHATDALFIALLLAALASRGLVAPWLPVLVAAAFVQYTLDSRALAGRALKSSWLGRTNGIAYFVVGSTPVYAGALGLHWPPDFVVQAASWALVATTLVSMADRLWAWRRRGVTGSRCFSRP